MTRRVTSDPWCNAVMEQWNAATAAGDQAKQLVFLSLCEKHRTPSIDWRRVAEDAGIESPTRSRKIGRWRFRTPSPAL